MLLSQHTALVIIFIFEGVQVTGRRRRRRRRRRAQVEWPEIHNHDHIILSKLLLQPVKEEKRKKNIEELASSVIKWLVQLVVLANLAALHAYIIFVKFIWLYVLLWQHWQRACLPCGRPGFYSPWGQNCFFQLDFICNFSKVLILYVIFRQGNSYLRNYFIIIYVILGRPIAPPG